MPGHRLEIGEHGDIAYRVHQHQVTASLYYRNLKGVRRRLEVTADSKAAARRGALARLERALAGGAAGESTARTTFAEVAEQWHRRFVEMVAAGHRSPTTAALYRHMLDRHVLPGLGSLRLAELTPARVDHFLQRTQSARGYPVAKLCRSIVSGACGVAVRAGALRSNPVRDAGRLEGTARPARALTPEECVRWLSILDHNAEARAKDLPGLARFLLGTGMRIGEALAVHWDDIDLELRTIHIRRTVVRVRGQGLIVKGPKSEAGVRVLRIPGWLVDQLAVRRNTADLACPVFADTNGGYRDRNNVEREFRLARKGTPFEWVVPHTYRKTVATWLDHGGLSARTIADQLGHARISMTQDVYLGRRAVDGRAAAALEDMPATERT